MTPAVALIDIGGSAVKVSIYARHMKSPAVYRLDSSPHSDGFRVTLNPDVLFQNVVAALKGASNLLSPGVEIGKVFISSIRQGFCLIRNDVEITPIIYNSDTSGEFAFSDVYDYGLDQIYFETGHWFAPQLTLPKIIHLKCRQPALFQDGTKLLFVHDWLAWRLTGEIATELTLVSGGQFADINGKGVNFELLDHFKFDSQLLPEVKYFGAPLGGLLSKMTSSLGAIWGKATVHIGGGDSHFLHVGATGGEAGVIAISAGSSTPISYISDNLENTDGMKPWKSTSFLKNKYFYEGNVGYPGTYFGWISRQKFADGSDGFKDVTAADISMAPHVFGSCRQWDPDSWQNCPPFSILDMKAGHTLAQIKLGLTLDYAFALKNQINSLSVSQSINLPKIVMVGGGANTLLAKVLQSSLGRTVQVVDSKICALRILKYLDGSTENENGNNSEVLAFEETVRLNIQAKELMHIQFYQEIQSAKAAIRNVA